MLAYEQIKANIETLKQRVSDVVAKCGRSDEIAIVAATKTQPKELIDFIEQKQAALRRGREQSAGAF